jgi:integrase/recombinase XerD
MQYGGYMYTHFKDELIIQLSTLGLSSDMLNTIMEQVDIVAYNYDIKEKETELIPYEYGLPELVNKYLVTKSVEGLSKDTLANYKRCLTHFFYFIKKQPEEINEEDITIFLYWYKRRNPEKEISDRSLDKILDTLKSFFKWAFNRRYIDYNPTSTLPPIKHARKVQDHLDDVELEQVRRACKTKKETALVEFLFSTGCRVSEVANVKLNDINWRDRTVEVFGKGKKYRTAFLNVRTCFCLQDYIENYRQGTSEYLFVSDRRPYNEIHKTGIEKIIRNIASRTNVDKHLTCHTFRRSLATQMLDKGAAIQDIQKILGHDKIETTMRYAKVNTKHVQETHRRFIA